VPTDRRGRKPPRSLPVLLLAVLGGVLLGAALVAAVDAVFALAGLGRFGDASGMFAAVPAVFVLYEEFRGAQALPGRTAVAAAAGAMALIIAAGAGYAVSGALPPLGSGAVAALASGVAYAIVWYTGRMHLERRSPS